MPPLTRWFIGRVALKYFGLNSQRFALHENFCFPENGVFRFFTAPFAGMEKWHTRIHDLLWPSLVNNGSSVIELVKEISIFFKFIILWTPSQFNRKKSKINGH